jgi:Flp pilus assembly protein TadD
VSNPKSNVPCVLVSEAGRPTHHRVRKPLIWTLLCAGLAASGCASVNAPKSLWPFGKTDNESAAPTTGLASSVTGAGKGMVGQFQSMGTAVKSAAGKAKTAVISPFATTEKSDDPTSLTNMPSIGPEVFVANGQLSEAQGNFTKALDNYTKALEIEPKNLSALLSTARLYDRQGQSAQAAEFFQKAIKAKPDDAALYNELGLCLNKGGKSAEAESYIQKAIALDPTNSRYRNNLAGLLVSSGRSDEAVKQLEQVFAPAVANYNVAYLHATNQNIAAAQQHLQVALRIDPNLKEARDLANHLGGSSTLTAATNAYNMAGNVLQTVQGLNAPSPYGTAAPSTVQQGAYSSIPAPTMQSQPVQSSGTQILR